MLNLTMLKYGGILLFFIGVLGFGFAKGSKYKENKLQPIIDKQLVDISNLKIDLEQEKLNVKIVTKFIYKTKIIEKKRNEIKSRFESLKKFDDKCVINPEFIELYDNATIGEEIPRTTPTVNGTTESTITNSSGN